MGRGHPGRARDRGPLRTRPVSSAPPRPGVPGHPHLGYTPSCEPSPPSASGWRGGGAPSAGGLRGPRTESPREHKQPWPAGGRGTEPWPGRGARVPGKNSLGSEGHSARKREAARAGENFQYLELFVIRHKAAVTFHKGGLCLGAGRFCAWFQSLRPVPHFQDLNLLSQSFSHPAALPPQFIQGDLSKWLCKNLMCDFLMPRWHLPFEHC